MTISLIDYSAAQWCLIHADDFGLTVAERHTLEQVIEGYFDGCDALTEVRGAVLTRRCYLSLDAS